MIAWLMQVLGMQAIGAGTPLTAEYGATMGSGHPGSSSRISRSERMAAHRREKLARRRNRGYWKH